MQWFAQAPSNIALIKYMGKKDPIKNIPDNPSLSYTLTNLLSSVVLEVHSSKKDYWEPLDIPGGLPFQLSTKGQERFLQHLKRVKDYLNYEGFFIVRSTNNFPHSSGLASSASSFAALTKCAVRAISELKNIPPLSASEMAHLSRQGSGSSCRSFFSPWALWQEDTVEPLDLSYHDLFHQVIVISHAEKQVSSRDAHERVKSSRNYVTRPQRATENLKLLLQAFEAKQWDAAFELCWREFQDMHQLFTSCSQPFTFMTENTRQVLNLLQDMWHKQGDGPLVTMDAGPNIHLLYRPEQREMAKKFQYDHLVGNYDVL